MAVAEQLPWLRVGLVGCVKTKLSRPARAKDLYVSPLFRGRRAFVEGSCDCWFVLSAKYGLLDPDQIIAPYDATLEDATIAERRAWSESVLAELRTSMGDLAGKTFEIHAGARYADCGLVSGLLAAKAHVDRVANGLGLGEQLAFYAAAAASPRLAGTVAAGREVPRHDLPAGRYAPLARFLAERPGSVTLSFRDVEALVGRLPPSARKHRAWWSNDRSHSQARAWLGVGYVLAEVDVRGESVRFDRK